MPVVIVRLAPDIGRGDTDVLQHARVELCKHLTLRQLNTPTLDGCGEPPKQAGMQLLNIHVFE